MQINAIPRTVPSMALQGIRWNNFLVFVLSVLFSSTVSYCHVLAITTALWTLSPLSIKGNQVLSSVSMHRQKWKESLWESIVHTVYVYAKTLCTQKNIKHRRKTLSCQYGLCLPLSFCLKSSWPVQPHIWLLEGKKIKVLWNTWLTDSSRNGAPARQGQGTFYTGASLRMSWSLCPPKGCPPSSAGLLDQTESSSQESCHQASFLISLVNGSPGGGFVQAHFISYHQELIKHVRKSLWAVKTFPKVTANTPDFNDFLKEKKTKAES